MKFQGSELERNYSDYWNETIVPKDQMIKKTIIHIVRMSYNDRTVFQVINKLLSNYIDTISTLIENIQTNTKSFEDNDYIKQYLIDITKQASEDINQYAADLNRSKNNTELLTYGFGRFYSKLKLEESNAEPSFSYEALVLEPLFDLGEAIDPFNISSINDIDL